MSRQRRARTSNLMPRTVYLAAKPRQSGRCGLISDPIESLLGRSISQECYTRFGSNHVAHTHHLRTTPSD